MSQLRPERHGGASLQTAGVSHGSKDCGEQRSGGRREGPAAQSWCRAGALSHTFRVADGRGSRRSGALDGLVAQGVALRLARTHCAHPLARRPRVLVARQHAVSEPTSLTCGTLTGKRLPDHTLGPPHGARALVVHARARRVGRGGNERAHTARAIASRGRNGGGARCTPRGRGRRPRAVVVSLAREDHTTTPRWRARAKNCVLWTGGEEN